MRTASEIAKEFISCTCGEVYLSRGMNAPDCPLHSYGVEGAINQARKEAIKECAERARLKYFLRENEVNKESILSLINDLK